MNIPTIRNQSYPALFQINTTSLKPFYQFYLQKSYRFVNTTAMQFKNAIFTIGILVSACTAAAVPEAQPRELTS